MSKPARSLSDEDRVLWTLVAKSTKPLKSTKVSAEPVPVVPKQPAEKPAPSFEVVMLSTPPVATPKRQVVNHVLDKPTLQKLSKGKLPIEGRVDLHGMTQGEAHGLLLSFLQRAHAGGVRYVLVITGKGSSSSGEGILRRAVPAWLTTPLFRPLVSSHDVAARQHGGAGAIYIRLRKQLADRP